jgi:hypothetical protein
MAGFQTFIGFGGNGVSCKRIRQTSVPTVAGGSGQTGGYARSAGRVCGTWQRRHLVRLLYRSHLDPWQHLLLSGNLPWNCLQNQWPFLHQSRFHRRPRHLNQLKNNPLFSRLPRLLCRR